MIGRPRAQRSAVSHRRRYYSETSQTPPLPASVVDYWHSELSCEPESWTSQIGGRILLQSGGTTQVEPDAAFNGHTVAKTFLIASGKGHYVGTGLTEIAASGTRPYTASVFALGAGSLAADGNHYLLTDAGLHQQTIHLRDAGTMANLYRVIVGADEVQTGNIADEAVHFLEVWLDGTNLNLAVDGVLYSVASVATIAGAVTGVYVGYDTEASHAMHMYCSSVPSAGERAALRTWAQSYFDAQ